MRQRLVGSFAALVMVLGLATGSAQACPSCKAANETDPNRPRAYMYSILFMLGVPVTVGAAFGIGFYRMHKRYREALATRYTDAGIELPPTDPS